MSLIIISEFLKAACTAAELGLESDFRGVSFDLLWKKSVIYQRPASALAIGRYVILQTTPKIRNFINPSLIGTPVTKRKILFDPNLQPLAIFFCGFISNSFSSPSIEAAAVICNNQNHALAYRMQQGHQHVMLIF